nr:phosphatidylglycerophosphatase A [uncultured Holophaga sp.]
MSHEAKAPRWAWWVATGFGSGCLKPAPGTWGSLAALVAWALIAAGLSRLSCRWAVELVLLLLPILLTWISVKASDLVVRETGLKDPGFIVADEWAGMWIALWGLRWEVLRGFRHPDWHLCLALLLPFVLFRVFDIWKPWPAYQVQILPEGQGIMADDVVAGFYALVLGQLLLGVGSLLV